MLSNYHGKSHVYKKHHPINEYNYSSSCNDRCSTSTARRPIAGCRTTIEKCSINTEKIIKGNRSQCLTNCDDNRIYGGKQEKDYNKKTAHRSYREYLRKKGKT